MPNIYKKVLIPGFFDEVLDPSDTNVRIDLSFQDNIILYKLYNSNNLKLSFNLDYDIIKTNSKFADQTVWSLTPACVKQLFSSTVEYTVTANDIVNVFSKTLAAKPTSLTYVNGEAIFFPLFNLFVPSLSSGINDIKISLPFSQNSDDTLDITYTFNNQEIFPESLALLKDHVEEITITTDKDNTDINEGDIINVTLTSDPSVKFIYVEERFGKVSKSVVRLTNGVGTFTVDTQDLLSGDDIEFKVGYKYFTGVSSFRKQIS